MWGSDNNLMCCSLISTLFGTQSLLFFVCVFVLVFLLCTPSLLAQVLPRILLSPLPRNGAALGIQTHAQYVGFVDLNSSLGTLAQQTL